MDSCVVSRHLTRHLRLLMEGTGEQVVRRKARQAVSVATRRRARRRRRRPRGRHQLRVLLSPQAMAILRRLHRSGLYGLTVRDVAVRLIDRQLQGLTEAR